jgi:hypothetical protein
MQRWKLLKSATHLRPRNFASKIVIIVGWNSLPIKKYLKVK